MKVLVEVLEYCSVPSHCCVTLWRFLYNLIDMYLLVNILV